MCYKIKPESEEEKRIIQVTKGNKIYLCRSHDNRPKIFCSKCADNIKEKCRAEALEEINWELQKINTLELKEKAPIVWLKLQDIFEAMEKRGEKK